MAVSPTEALDIRATFTLLWRRRIVLLLALLAAAGAAYAYDLTKPDLYHGNTSILLQPSQSAGLFGDQSGLTTNAQDQDRLIKTEIKVLESRTVRARVAQTIPNPAKVSGAQAGLTNVMVAEVADTDAKRAAATADAYADAYIALRREQSVADNLAASEQVNAKVVELNGELETIDNQITALAAEDAKKGTDAAGKPIPGFQANPEIASLRQNRAILLNNQSLFKEKLDQLSVDTALQKSTASVIEQSAVPKLRFSPRPKRDAVFAGAAGLVLAALVLLGLDFLDDRIKGRDDVEAATGGLAVVGTVPKQAIARGAAVDKVLVSRLSPTSLISEAYRGVRTNLQFIAMEQQMRRLVVTSSSAGEGKTTTSTNLALTLAKAGQRVILVDADLRKPRVADLLGLSNLDGVATVVAGSCSLSDALQIVDGEVNLRVLPAGPVPASPAEVLNSPRMNAMLDTLARECDILVIDTPPVLAVSDAAVLARRADAVVYVISASKCTKRQLARGVDALRQVGAHLAGAVINAADKEHDGYGYGYGYGYGQAEENEPKRGRRARVKSAA